MKILLPLIIMLMTFLGCQSTKKTNIIPIVHSPFKGIKTDFDVFKIDPSKENEIVTKYGTFIHIPANAIVDKNGMLVKSRVEINCREFHSQADIMSCGIPMTYDSSGQSLDFISGGMIELRGKVNNEDVFIRKNSSLGAEFASYDNINDFNLYKLNDTTGEWQFRDKSMPNVNLRKVKKLDEFRNDFIIELDIDYSSNPELKIFDKLSWIYTGKDKSKDPASEKWIFEEKWREIKLTIVNQTKSIYNMQLKSHSKKLDLLVSPYVEGNEAVFLSELNQGILEHNEIVSKRKEEELSIQFEADMTRNFKMSSFGIHNIDRINPLIESGDVFATNAGFVINGKEKRSKGKIFLFSGNEKSLLIRDDVVWENLFFKASEDNTLMVALPDNYIAICGQSEFEKAKGNNDYDFKFDKLIKVSSLKDIEALIESI